MLIIKQQGHSHLTELSEKLTQQISTQGDDFSSQSSTKLVTSLESASGAQVEEFSSLYEAMKAELQVSFEGVPVSETGLEAAAVVALGTGNPLEYNAKVNTVTDVAGTGIEVVSPISYGPAGSIDAGYEISMEAFDESELSKHRATSIIYNAYAAEQDTFCEAFFPTMVLTPDTAGIDIEIVRSMVRGNVVHDPKDPISDFNRRNLINAVADAKILDNNSTDLVPWAMEDNSNAEYFIDKALVAPSELLVDGKAVRTAPLAFGKKGNLLSLSSGSAATAGENLTGDDSIHPGLRIKYLDVVFANKDGSKKDVVRFDVSQLVGAQFFRGPNGDSREMSVNFQTDALTISSKTKDISGAAPETFTAFNAKNWTAYISLNINGTVNLETGAYHIYASGINYDRVTNAAGDTLDLSSAEVTTVTDALLPAAGGFRLDVRRSNINHRTRGLIVDDSLKTERHTVTLDSPLTVTTPVNGSDPSGNGMRSLITTARIRTANRAVTTLLNYVDAMDNKIYTGAGRHLIKPFFQKITVDMEARINSNKSHEKAADAQAVLVDAMRDAVYRMDRDSNYSAALAFHTGSGSEKPHVLIGTDTILGQYLMIEGDDRTLSTGYDYSIVTTADVRMENTILLTFQRKGETKPSGLSFGIHGYIPAMTAQLQVSRGNSTVRESRVQPRSIHVPVLPCMVKLEIINLDKVMNEKTK